MPTVERNDQINNESEPFNLNIQCKSSATLILKDTNLHQGVLYKFRNSGRILKVRMGC